MTKTKTPAGDATAMSDVDKAIAVMMNGFAGVLGERPFTNILKDMDGRTFASEEAGLSMQVRTMERSFGEYGVKVQVRIYGDPTLRGVLLADEDSVKLYANGPQASDNVTHEAAQLTVKALLKGMERRGRGKMLAWKAVGASKRPELEEVPIMKGAVPPEPAERAKVKAGGGLGKAAPPAKAGVVAADVAAAVEAEVREMGA
jgi:hypothetical protein